MAPHPGFREWYATWQAQLTKDPLARFFVESRNVTQKIGEHPIRFGSYQGGHVRMSFGPGPEFDDVPDEDVVSCCRTLFKRLLEIVYDCYVRFGQLIDPQQYYTEEAFAARGLTIDDADEELIGIRAWTSVTGSKDEEKERWRLHRCNIGFDPVASLFVKYLGKTDSWLPIDLDA